MKKKMLSAMFAVAIMAVAGYNVYMNQTKSNFSELALANIEALAEIENYDVYNFSLEYKPRSGTFEIDVEGYISILGKRFKIGEGGFNGKITVAYEIAGCTFPSPGNYCPASKIGDIKIVSFL